MSLPPMPPVPHMPTCRWHGNQHVPRVAFAWAEGVPVPPLRICVRCDMGDRPDAGPPVMLDYLKRGHQ